MGCLQWCKEQMSTGFHAELRQGRGLRLGHSKSLLMKGREIIRGASFVIIRTYWKPNVQAAYSWWKQSLLGGRGGPYLPWCCLWTKIFTHPPTREWLSNRLFAFTCLWVHCVPCRRRHSSEGSRQWVGSHSTYINWIQVWPYQLSKRELHLVIRNFRSCLEGSAEMMGRKALLPAQLESAAFCLYKIHKTKAGRVGYSPISYQLRDKLILLSYINQSTKW